MTVLTRNFETDLTDILDEYSNVDRYFYENKSHYILALANVMSKVVAMQNSYNGQEISVTKCYKDASDETVSSPKTLRDTFVHEMLLLVENRRCIFTGNSSPSELILTSLVDYLKCNENKKVLLIAGGYISLSRLVSLLAEAGLNNLKFGTRENDQIQFGTNTIRFGAADYPAYMEEVDYIILDSLNQFSSNALKDIIENKTGVYSEKKVTVAFNSYDVRDDDFTSLYDKANEYGFVRGYLNTFKLPKACENVVKEESHFLDDVLSSKTPS